MPAPSPRPVATAPAPRSTRLPASHREPRFGARPFRDTSTEFGLTEENSVTHRTFRLYERLMEAMLHSMQWARFPEDAQQADAGLVKFFDRLYMEGHDATVGDRFLAAVMFHHPRFSRVGDLGLPRASRSLRGWHRLRPSGTRRPLPWEVVCGLAGSLIGQGQPLMALCWLLMVDTYMRPGEAVDLLNHQVVPRASGTGMQKTCIHLNPGYRGKFSKTGELDESLQVNRDWLGSLLEMVHRWRCLEPRLWPFSLAQLREKYMIACKELDILKWDPVLYMGRHSGASLDRLQGNLTLEAVQKRGRWRSAASVRRYEKHASVQDVWNKMSDPPKRCCTKWARGLVAKLRGVLLCEINAARPLRGVPRSTSSSSQAAKPGALRCAGEASTSSASTSFRGNLETS